MSQTFRIPLLVAALLSFSLLTTAQHSDAVDTAIVSKFRKEGFKNSQVMDILSMLTDMNGPRLTNSPGYKKAATYAKSTLEGWGVSRVYFDSFGEFGRGWFVKKFSLQAMEPAYFPVIGYPKAWSPGIKGTRAAEAVYLDVKTEEDLEKYKGKLKGKIVLFSLPIMPKPAFKPDATRLTDSTLLRMANAAASNRAPGSSRRYIAGPPEMLTYKKWRLCESEGALAVIEGSRGSYGTYYAQGATIPTDPATPAAQRFRPQAANAPEILPQLVVAAEHYNRMVRQLEKGLLVKLELTMETEFTKPEDGFNVIGEIEGSDKKDEVVMIGAHLDSWHSGTGTTDNGVGVAICMEAMRILTASGVQPSRSIRIGLWGGEEQGLFGSTGYVKKHLGERAADSVKLTTEGKKFSVYFNTDNGSGKWRGINMQGNENVRSMFREWLRPFEKDGSATLTLNNTGSTDHVPFDAIGLPGFQFITDPIEYFTRSWHSSMDMYERAVEADLKHNAVMLATFAWGAANREALVSRK
ncbi:M28 family peptidase [Chryseolinea lacunae]|uniref:Carboxypeptidase Q n=1 Tax=Chryseolinea lacunae TaxID=2801331 RepID=A0ABS1KRL6_9BACT|nr:M28 family peptidase [Chryseolinea lacunae]MBL0741902.1 M20/M25/M40 family metallo-hydrolase [Chryseolinea lacunae]